MDRWDPARLRYRQAQAAVLDLLPLQGPKGQRPKHTYRPLWKQLQEGLVKDRIQAMKETTADRTNQIDLVLLMARKNVAVAVWTSSRLP